MGKCVLDLTNVGKYGKLGYKYDMAESIILDSVNQINLFESQILGIGPDIVSPRVYDFILVDDEIYPNEIDNLDVYGESHNLSSKQWLDSLKDPLNSGVLKSKNPIDTGQYVTDVWSYIVHTGIQSDVYGRFNLGDVDNADPCKRGFYGLIANKIESIIPIYEVCYVPRTEAMNSIFVQNIKLNQEPMGPPSLFKATRRKDLDIVSISYKNERGPVVISDEISIRSGLGTSIVPDLVRCPPYTPPIFHASDVDFGEIEAGTVNEKDVFLFNRTLPTASNSGELRIIDISPKEHTNFKIMDFKSAVGLTPLIKSPTNISDTNPLIMSSDLNNPITFGVQYNPAEEYGITHTAEITYLVETTTSNPEKVTQEKLTTKLSGTAYRVNVSCSDANLGKIDVYNLTNPFELVIQNSGSKDVYMYKYELIESRGEQNFTITSEFKPTPQDPIIIPAGKDFKITGNYNPKGITEFEHKARIRYYFKYDHPVLGPQGAEVNGTKVISYLSATGYSDPIDEITDDVIDLVTDDENGVFVTKTLSVILDKSSVTQKNRTFPLWNCVGDRLYEIYTGSNGVKMDKYYLPIYNKPTNQSDSHHQFDISYGHLNGSGSSYYDGTNLSELRPSKAMYRKYLVECYGQMSGSYNIPKKFVFRNNVESDSVYFIQLDRDDYRDMLDPGNFEISLVPLSSSLNQLYNTGSNFYVNTSSSVVYKLIDDSSDTKQDRTDRSGLNSFYYIVSGSLQQGVYGEPTDNVWGMVFPKMGLIVLDGNVLDQSCSFNTVTASIDGDNTRKLFLSLSGSMTVSDGRPVSESMFARSAEKMLIQTYFCRANPNEFNYSNNPTFVSGKTNQIKYDYFIKDPKTYITTIGLYNNKNELIAVGKLKKPLLKTDKTQYVLQVRVRIM